MAGVRLRPDGDDAASPGALPAGAVPARNGPCALRVGADGAPGSTAALPLLPQPSRRLSRAWPQAGSRETSRSTSQAGKSPPGFLPSGRSRRKMKPWVVTLFSWRRIRRPFDLFRKFPDTCPGPKPGVTLPRCGRLTPGYHRLVPLGRTPNLVWPARLGSRLRRAALSMRTCQFGPGTNSSPFCARVATTRRTVPVGENLLTYGTVSAPPPVPHSAFRILHSPHFRRQLDRLTAGNNEPRC